MKKYVLCLISALIGVAFVASCTQQQGTTATTTAPAAAKPTLTPPRRHLRRRRKRNETRQLGGAVGANICDELATRAGDARRLHTCWLGDSFGRPEPNH